MPFSHPGRGTRQQHISQPTKERRKRRKLEERAIPASRSRVQSVEQRCHRSRTSEGRWKNVKPGNAKIITKISARFRIPEACNGQRMPEKFRVKWRQEYREYKHFLFREMSRGM